MPAAVMVQIVRIPEDGRVELLFSAVELLRSQDRGTRGSKNIVNQFRRQDLKLLIRLFDRIGLFDCRGLVRRGNLVRFQAFQRRNRWRSQR